jgi:hypothetical protein
MNGGEPEFPLLDLTLPGAAAGAAAPPRRAAPGWAVKAVIAAEVLGPPLALRPPPATLGEPRAF